MTPRRMSHGRRSIHGSSGTRAAASPIPMASRFFHLGIMAGVEAAGATCLCPCDSADPSPDEARGVLVADGVSLPGVEWQAIADGSRPRLSPGPPAPGRAPLPSRIVQRESGVAASPSRGPAIARRNVHRCGHPPRAARKSRPLHRLHFECLSGSGAVPVCRVRCVGADHHGGAERPPGPAAGRPIPRPKSSPRRRARGASCAPTMRPILAECWNADRCAVEAVYVEPWSAANCRGQCYVSATRSRVGSSGSRCCPSRESSTPTLDLRPGRRAEILKC